MEFSAEQFKHQATSHGVLKSVFHPYMLHDGRFKDPVCDSYLHYPTSPLTFKLTYCYRDLLNKPRADLTYVYHLKIFALASSSSYQVFSMLLQLIALPIESMRSQSLRSMSSHRDHSLSCRPPFGPTHKFLSHVGTIGNY